MRFYDSKVRAAANFANKIWNASRFVAMNLEGVEISRDMADLNLDIADQWILSRLNTLIAEVTDNMEKFELGLAAGKVYDFIWSEYCDWYIEMCKARLYGGDAGEKQTALSVLSYVLKEALKLLHPFMPFITEEVYVELLREKGSIMLSLWPCARAEFSFPAEEAAMAGVMEITRSVRNTRVELNVPPSKKARVIIHTSNSTPILAAEEYIKRLAGASSVEIRGEDAPEPKNAASAITAVGRVYLPLGDLIDVGKEHCAFV